MAGRALFGALGVIWALLAPAHAGADDATANKQDTAAVQKPSLPNEIPAPVAAPRAAQIEPVMVEPVKRVAPRTPESKTPEKKIKQVVTIEKDPALDKKNVPDNTKSCGAGQKRSKDGAKCEKVASVSKKGGKRR